mgnify:CR=1 FL=1
MNTRIISISSVDGSFALAVNPKEVTVSSGAKLKTLELLNAGDIAMAGNRTLVKIAIQNTFLPSLDSPFYKGTPPDTILALMKKCRDAPLPVRIIISGTDINRQFWIETMEEKYVEGDKDPHVSWSFTEYRQTTVLPVASLAGKQTYAGLNQRAPAMQVPKSVTVKKGTTMWDLAKKYYGDGNRWKEIQAANGGINERKLQIGMVLVIP